MDTCTSSIRADPGVDRIYKHASWKSSEKILLEIFVFEERKSLATDWLELLSVDQLICEELLAFL